jgi:hypothetical protein
LQIKAVSQPAGFMSRTGQAEPCQIWNVQRPLAFADNIGSARSAPRCNVAKRAGARIAELRCVRRRSDAEGV